MRMFVLGIGWWLLVPEVALDIWLVCFLFVGTMGDDLQPTDIAQFNMQERKGLW
jgi:hypothetical protein